MRQIVLCKNPGGKAISCEWAIIKKKIKNEKAKKQHNNKTVKRKNHETKKK